MLSMLVPLNEASVTAIATKYSQPRKDSNLNHSPHVRVRKKRERNKTGDHEIARFAVSALST